MSILSPISRDRFQLLIVDYGNASPGNIHSFAPFTANATLIINLTCRLATSVTINDRTMYLELLRDSVWTSFAPSLIKQPANKLIKYSFAPAVNSPTVADSAFVPCAIPPDMLMVKDDVLSIKVINGDAADVIQGITVYWKIFPTG